VYLTTRQPNHPSKTDVYPTSSFSPPFSTFFSLVQSVFHGIFFFLFLSEGPNYTFTSSPNFNPRGSFLNKRGGALLGKEKKELDPTGKKSLAARLLFCPPPLFFLNN